MWKRVLGLAAQFWRIAENTESNTAEPKELRQELREMACEADHADFVQCGRQTA